MRVFTRNQKINFVDENNAFLGYDMEQNCCEHADWFIADQPTTTKQARDTDDPDLTGFVFDPSFFQRVDGLPDFCRHGDTHAVDPELELSFVIFRIVKGNTEKFIHIFNSNNGYYLHGFNFGRDSIDFRKGKI